MSTMVSDNFDHIDLLKIPVGVGLGKNRADVGAQNIIFIIFLEIAKRDQKLFRTFCFKFMSRILH